MKVEFRQLSPKADPLKAIEKMYIQLARAKIPIMIVSQLKDGVTVIAINIGYRNE